jgi:hypothetical protein
MHPMCECCGRPFPALASTTVVGAEGTGLFPATVATAATGAESVGNFPAVATGGAAAVAGVEVAKPLCRLCRGGNYAFDRARSYSLYDDALHHAILLLKYEEVTRLVLSHMEHWESVRGAYATRKGLRVDKL